MTVERRERIRALNDQLRRFHTGGRIMITRGVVAEGEAFLTNALLLIAAFDDFFAHAGHLCDAFSVIDDRSIRVIGYDDTGEGKHADRGDADAVDTGKAERLSRKIGREGCSCNS